MRRREGGARERRKRSVVIFVSVCDILKGVQGFALVAVKAGAAAG